MSADGWGHFSAHGLPAPPVFFSLLTNVSESWKTPQTRKCVGKRKQKLSKFQQSCVVCSWWVLLGQGPGLCSGSQWVHLTVAKFPLNLVCGDVCAIRGPLTGGHSWLPLCGSCMRFKFSS